MQLIRNVFILSIVSLLVMGSVGIDVFKHICKEDGVTVTLFVEADHHCKEEVQTSCCSGHDEKDCCDDEVEHVQIQPDYYNDFFSPEWIAVIAGKPLSFVLEEKVISEEINISNYPQPPPLSGRQLLTNKQVWII
ncbi:MAG: HYC_CC_PP family protein [Crocinitomicaceae bacterium]